MVRDIEDPLGVLEGTVTTVDCEISPIRWSDWVPGLM